MKKIDNKNKKKLQTYQVPDSASLIFSGNDWNGVKCSLHRTLDNWIMKKEGDDITLLSYDQAESWAEEVGYCDWSAEFTYRFHNPNGDVYDEERAPADAAFSLESRTRIKFRVQELLKLREFQKCTIRSDRSVTTMEMRNEDRDKVIEMLSYLDYEPDAFDIPYANFECLESNCSISQKGTFQFECSSSDRFESWCAVYFYFWHSHAKIKKMSLPKFHTIKHTWINVYDGILPDGEPCRQLIRHVVAEIIRFQLEHESNWARDPDRELKKFPRNPDAINMSIFTDRAIEKAIF